MYWAVYVYVEMSEERNGRKITTMNWAHHMSLDTRQDALEEAEYCQRQGERVKVIRQDW